MKSYYISYNVTYKVTITVDSSTNTFKSFSQPWTQSMTTGFNVEAEKMNAYNAYSLSLNNFKDYITKNTTENYIPDSESLCVLAWSVNED